VIDEVIILAVGLWVLFVNCYIEIIGILVKISGDGFGRNSATCEAFTVVCSGRKDSNHHKSIA
jgi:hypothetical protein